MEPTNNSSPENDGNVVALQQQIDELKAQQEALQKQLEERQELMQNLFSFVESNLKK